MVSERDVAAMVRTRYTTVAITLHWIIAALILANVAVGFRMQFLKGLAQFNVFQLHKSIGISILLLSLGRLAWRLGNPPPPADGLAPWEHVASTVVHWGFYVVMIGMPLSGWLLVSTSPMNIPTLLFHLVPWPHVPGAHTLAPAARTAVNHGSDAVHVTLAWGFLGLLALHLGAVAKHQWFDSHPVLGRMLPLPGVGGRTPISET